LAEILDLGAHRLGVALEGIGAGIDFGGEDCHGRAKLPVPGLACKASEGQ
jgi:hypothetical protein